MYTVRASCAREHDAKCKIHFNNYVLLLAVSRTKAQSTLNVIANILNKKTVCYEVL